MTNPQNKLRNIVGEIVSEW